MDYIKKASREDLEEMFRTLMDNLEIDSPELFNKYKSDVEDYIYAIDIDEATDIVRNMKPMGEKFSYSTVESYLVSKGMNLEESELVKYYLVMNMFANDYKKIFDKYPQINTTEMYYEFTNCFINDEDAPKHKVGKYFKM